MQWMKKFLRVVTVAAAPRHGPQTLPRDHFPLHYLPYHRPALAIAWRQVDRGKRTARGTCLEADAMAWLWDPIHSYGISMRFLYSLRASFAQEKAVFPQEFKPVCDEKKFRVRPSKISRHDAGELAPGSRRLSLSRNTERQIAGGHDKSDLRARRAGIGGPSDRPSACQSGMPTGLRTTFKTSRTR